MEERIIRLVGLQRRIGNAARRGEATTYKHHPIDVMDVTVLPAPVMHVIPGHRDFRTTEHSRLFMHQHLTQ